MKLTLSWDAPANHYDGTPCADIEFYRVGYCLASNRSQERSRITTLTTITLDLLDGPGLYVFQVMACHADERCSIPAEFQWYVRENVDPHEVDLTIRLSKKGEPIVGWNAKPGCEYVIERGFDWTPIEWNIKGNGFIEWAMPPGVKVVRVLEVPT